MTLEPRSVEPGYAKRWSKQALELVFRSLHWWLAVFLAAGLLLWAGEGFGLLLTPVGMFLYGFSTLLAHRSDQGTVGPQAIFECAWYSIHRTWEFFKKNWMGLLAMLAAGALFVWALSTLPAPENAPPPPEPSLFFGPGSPFVYLASAVWLGAFLPFFEAPRTPMLWYCAREHMAEGADLMLVKGFQKNMLACSFLEMAHLIALMAAIVFMPILAVLLGCFLPALSYVAYREIFIHPDGNKKVQEATNVKLATAGASS